MFYFYNYRNLEDKYISMKLCALIIGFAFIANNSSAQKSGDITSAQIASWITKPAGFTTVSDAKTMIAEIIDVIGLKPNFEVMAARIDNAAAVVYLQKRYILYNPDFINRLDAAAGNKWASVSILAHEIGHHLNGHMMQNIGSQPEKELEADEFSGFVLRRMGATLAQAQTALKLAANYKTSVTHPNKTDRLTSIASGWTRANIQQGGKDLAKTTPVTKPVTERNEPTLHIDREQRENNNVARNYPKTNSESLINERYIVADITFAAEQQSSFYVTTRFNIVREMNNRLYSIGKMLKTNNSAYPYIITDAAGTKLWVNSQGYIINGNNRSVGFLKVRR